jgi:hypothetical protein
MPRRNRAFVSPDGADEICRRTVEHSPQHRNGDTDLSRSAIGLCMANTMQFSHWDRSASEGAEKRPSPWASESGGLTAPFHKFPHLTIRTLDRKSAGIVKPLRSGNSYPSWRPTNVGSLLTRGVSCSIRPLEARGACQVPAEAVESTASVCSSSEENPPRRCGSTKIRRSGISSAHASGDPRPLA